ncbi:MAG: Gfo/Idh/MocA family oxidoreductase [Candidatus Hydrogenedentes bacterium]|nr:Gfo/Idh/MocA family oxidoreductase [Candidatus Hydrogenedentota bacterium]
MTDRTVRAPEPARISAPTLPYLPRTPKTYHPNIGLIGCGGIAPYHLRAYKTRGYKVVALCDIDPARADGLQAQYFPEAKVYTDYQEVLRRPDIEVVDVATHPGIRVEMVASAIEAGKHVLSQKPFAMDLDVGEKLCDMAERREAKLAVNQNGRWAPHFAYIREAIALGLIGKPIAAHLACHWDHNWTAGTAFDAIKHLILFDFGIHWYDILGCFLPGLAPARVYASTTSAAGQKAKPSLLAQVAVEYDSAQASIAFDGSTRFGRRDSTIVVGTDGTIDSDGPDLHRQTVTLHTPQGSASPELEGEWFTNGFEGAMGELLCAIEENREPFNSGRDNLKGLAICFAAVESAETHQPVAPGSVRRLTAL